ncbi:MAG: hypothetical protein ABFD62_04745 [Syntrophaceae bacterium]
MAKPKILLDSDVIRHFLKGSRILDLPKIYPEQLALLDIVKSELCRSRQLQIPVNNFLSMCKIEQISFPTHNMEIMREYAALRKRFGDGESACMALARFESHFIASSNLIDISAYCEQHGIVYLTTMDVLVEGLNKGIMTEGDCDAFIKRVKEKGSKLPVDSIREYMGKKS